MATTIVQAQNLEIEAPSDTTVSANRNGCWAVIDLPEATVVDSGACGGPLTFETRTPFDTLNTNGGITAFRLGTHDVYYIVRDTCGDADSMIMQVTVEDTIPPVAICTGPKTVNLGGSGMALIPAFTFDGGSIEFCFKYYKVRRLIPDSTCTVPGNDSMYLDDVVKFCCQDINDTIEVTLRVYDVDPGPGPVDDTLHTGHFSDCTAMVIVRDKIAPRLICPPDTTIECGDHIVLETLGLPTYEDECDSVVIEVKVENDFDQCGTGEIRRVFIGTDKGGNKDTCIQTIFVENTNKFDGLDTNDLKWPEPFVMIFDCNKHPDTSLSGGPKFVDDGCSLVSVNWEDDYYKFSREACVKVIRNWKVIDWCQYDPKVNSKCTPSNGCWTFEQIIKVVDTIPADIIEPVDILVPYLGAECEEIYVNIPDATADTCYFGEEIIITHRVDLFSDGKIDRQSDTSDASGLYAPGIHTIIYEAVDGCHNTSFDTTILTVKDRTTPTPIAMNGVSLVLTDMGGGNIMTTFRAEDLNASSYDNCTDQANLIFSWSDKVGDSIKIFDCDDVPNANVELWVTDECGNQDFVNIILVVTDPSNSCGNIQGMSEISGAIARMDGMKLVAVDIDLDNSGVVTAGSTDNGGDYVFRQVDNGTNYRVRPQRNGDHMEGVSTGDLILIQRHLLGKTPLRQLDKLIAADVNETGHISAKDIADLRSLIIGNVNELPNGKSWTFIPTSFVFSDPTDPFASPWPEEYVVTNLLNSMRIDFFGVKLGDLNDSFDGFNSNKTRGQDVVELLASYDKDNDQIVFSAAKEMWIEGLQLSISMSEWEGDLDVESLVLEGWNESYYAYNEETKELKISYNSPEMIWVGAKASIFQIPCGNNQNLPLIALDEEFSECYTSEGDINSFELTGMISDQREGKELNISAEPNPFLMETILTIYSDQETDASLNITGIAGNKIYSSELHLNKGWNEVLVDDEIERSGIYIVTISNGYSPKSIRVVRME